MAALPGPEWSDSPSTDGPPPLARIEWGFTHFTMTLAIVARAESPEGAGWWQPTATLDDAGLPSLYAKAVAAVLASRAAHAA